MTQQVRTFFAPHLPVMDLEGSPLPMSIERIVAEVGSPIMQVTAAFVTSKGPIFGVVLGYDAATGALEVPTDPSLRRIASDVTGHGSTEEEDNRLALALAPYALIDPLDPRVRTNMLMRFMGLEAHVRTGIRVRSYFAPRLSVDGHPVYVERIIRDMGSPIMLLTIHVTTSVGKVSTKVRYDAGKRITIDLPEEPEARQIVLDARGPGSAFNPPNPLAEAVEPYIRD